MEKISMNMGNIIVIFNGKSLIPNGKIHHKNRSQNHPPSEVQQNQRRRGTGHLPGPERCENDIYGAPKLRHAMNHGIWVN